MRVLLGSIELPMPTGRWRYDADGGVWEEHTPMRWLDANGAVEREEPYQPLVRMMGISRQQLIAMGYKTVGDWPADERPKPRRWWQF